MAQTDKNQTYGNTETGVIRTRCYFFNPSPWEAVSKLLMLKPQYGTSIFIQSVRPGVFECSEDGMITVAEQPASGREFKIAQWDLSDINTVDLKRITKKEMLNIGLLRWLQIGIIAAVLFDLVMTAYILLQANAGNAPYFRDTLLHLTWISVVVGAFLGFLLGFLSSLSYVIWFRFFELVIRGAGKEIPLLLNAKHKDAVLDQLALFGIHINNMNKN